VVLITESKSNLNSRISRLPCLVNVEIPSPDSAERDHYIEWFNAQLGADERVEFESGLPELAQLTAGLSIHALRQLMLRARHERRQLTTPDVVDQVETFIEDQLGEGVVEFKKPSHTLDDVIGFSGLRKFLRNEAIPRFRSTGLDALSGAIVCGPNGVGKSFIFEAVATELKTIVLILKNIRSQWFGQTDVVFERLRRILHVLQKALIFVDEADTQFGGLGPEDHPTERRLTGKFQEVMADPRLRGRITWLLMTARIHLLSPDIKRPGRGGDLIIPVLDPEGDDRIAFIKWMVQPAMGSEPQGDVLEQLQNATKSFFPATFASVRSLLIARTKHQEKLSEEEIVAIVSDHLPPAIVEERRFQTLQALVHCNRKSLLPNPNVSEEERLTWEHELRKIEAREMR
jgi:SpoVK/Ycf46/Vps4 family AAA+-type ATPase